MGILCMSDWWDAKPQGCDVWGSLLNGVVGVSCVGADIDQAKNVTTNESSWVPIQSGANEWGFVYA